MDLPSSAWTRASTQPPKTPVPEMRRQAGDGSLREGISLGCVLLGAHVSVSGGIHTAIDRIDEMGGEAVQIFTQSPRMWRPTNHDPANLERFKERRAEAGGGKGLCPPPHPRNPPTPQRDNYEKYAAAPPHTAPGACAIDAAPGVFPAPAHHASRL